MEVWKSIRDDTTMIFQWESISSQLFLKKFMSDETLDIARRTIGDDFSMVKWFSFGNGLIRPACASFRDEVAKGKFYDNGFDALNKLLANEAGRIAMQETIMMFLVKFCGYSDAESDNVRRAIAKKKGTEQLLPEIEHRFIEYSSAHYDISKEKCQEIITPFIKIILDASEYGFSQNHSDSYSIIGYVCGYLRHYYPLEFITATLNIFSDNTEKTANIIKYAKKVGIKVTQPKFGISRANYSFSKEENTISKGLSSVKYMNEQIAEELYNISLNNYSSFMQLLLAINEHTTVDSGQLDKLIKIDFFSKFGNQRELLRIVGFFEDFKKGNAKKIKKDGIAGTELEEIVKMGATDINKDGSESKSYTITDINLILKSIEKKVRSLNLEDLSDTIKVKNFEDIMGYSGYVTGEERDRPKLYIKSVTPLKRKKDKKQFGYSIITQSLGSGIESRFTVFNGVYNKEPIEKGDLIKCLDYDRDGAYFTLTNYRKIY